MKKLFTSSPFLLLLFAFNQVNLRGQQVPQSPDCGPIFINQAITTGTTIPIPSITGKDNRTLGCQTWVLAYQANATSGTFTSIEFQSASGAVTPGTFGAWPGTVNTGINPNTNQTEAVTTFSTGCVNAVACTVDNAWVRVLITRNNFVGTITGVLYGYKTGPIFNVVATVVPAGTQNVNLVQIGSNTVVTGGVNGSLGVGGLAADGADQAGRPVLVAGHDNDAPTPNVRIIQTDTNGQILPSSAAVAMADGTSNTPNIPTFGVGGAAAPTTFRNFPFVFDGATWDRIRSAALANDPVATLLIGRNSIGALNVEFGSRWVVNSSPATSSQASASIAAEASVRHVADNVCFSAQSAGAVAASALTITIRDGATGAGTVLRTFQVAIPVASATGQQEVPIFCTPTGMGLVGTTNTAMTAEFSAGVTNLNEAISITGYNVN